MSLFLFCHHSSNFFQPNPSTQLHLLLLWFPLETQNSTTTAPNLNGLYYTYPTLCREICSKHFDYSLNEIKLEIFGYLTDVKSITSFRLANHGVNDPYLDNTMTIIKRVMATIGGDSRTLQLALWAGCASGVDYRRRQSVELFLRRFLSRPIPDCIYSLRTVYYTVWFIKTIEGLLSLKIEDTAYADTAFIKNTHSITERCRLCRALCMLEIDDRVFHGLHSRPDKPGFGFRSLFPDLEKKYWRAFSKGEISQLFVARLITESAMLHA